MASICNGFTKFSITFFQILKYPSTKVVGEMKCNWRWGGKEVVFNYNHNGNSILKLLSTNIVTYPNCIVEMTQNYLPKLETKCSIYKLKLLKSIRLGSECM